MPATSQVECVKTRSAQRVDNRYRRLSLYPQQMRSYAVGVNFLRAMLRETDKINGFVHNFSIAPNLALITALCYIALCYKLCCMIYWTPLQRSFSLCYHASTAWALPYCWQRPFQLGCY